MRATWDVNDDEGARKIHSTLLDLDTLALTNKHAYTYTEYKKDTGRQLTDTVRNWNQSGKVECQRESRVLLRMWAVVTRTTLRVYLQLNGGTLLFPRVALLVGDGRPRFKLSRRSSLTTATLPQIITTITGHWRRSQHQITFFFVIINYRVCHVMNQKYSRRDLAALLMRN
jgi:hypothetical protein